jgi:hypothetical protein
MNLKQFVRIQRLHLFTDDTDTVVAYDANDAVEVWKEHTEDSRDVFDPPFEQVPDNQIQTISSEIYDFEDMKKHAPLFSKISPGKDYDECPSVSAPAWAWALHDGRCFLCSTEW